jgi:hypothetical protein
VEKIGCLGIFEAAFASLGDWGSEGTGDYDLDAVSVMFATWVGVRGSVHHRDVDRAVIACLSW